MYDKIAILGDADSILAFKSIGIECFEVYQLDDAKEIIRRLVQKRFAVIFIVEDLMAELEVYLAEYKKRPYPAIIPLPGVNGTNGYCMDGIKKDMERAIGSDILFDRED